MRSKPVTGSPNGTSTLEFRCGDRRADNLRRSGDWGTPNDKKRLGEWICDMTGRQLTPGPSAPTDLTLREYKMLLVFALSPRQLVTCDQLESAETNRGSEPHARAVDAQVSSLRLKIDSDLALPSLIRTVQGAGYMFVPQRV
jgi:DNA-binding response OmpR family regulator